MGRRGLVGWAWLQAHGLGALSPRGLWEEAPAPRALRSWKERMHAGGIGRCPERRSGPQEVGRLVGILAQERGTRGTFGDWHFHRPYLRQEL